MVQFGFAQQKTITGTITDESGLPLPGATVVIENTTRGVSSDFDGNFSIDTAEGEVMVVSFVGYADQRLTVGTADNYTISLAPSNELDEVVVTSLGIERDVKALGYAVQTVDSEDIVNTGSSNAVDALTGKAAGTYLVAGNQYGAIFGGAYLREGAGGANDDGLNIPEGQVVINDDSTSSEYGYQSVDPTQRAIGNPNPDFIVGWNNSFRFKNIKFGFLLDWREGGDLWNGTAWALSFFGRTPLTAESRVETPTPIQGVLPNGQPNNIPVVRDQNYWTSSLGGFGAVGEQFVQDGGWIRLRELSISYDIPFSKWGFNFIKSGGISFIGRNLWRSNLLLLAI